MAFRGCALLASLFLFLAFSYHTVSAQPGREFALTMLNKSSITCDGSSNTTPEIEGLRQAACLTPFPCLDSRVARKQIAGQCSYTNPISFSQSRSFSTMFSFNTLKYPTYLPGEGFTFFLASTNPGNVSDLVGGDLGWIDQSAIRPGDHTGNNFAVEFDLVSQTTGGFNDPPDDHVGINVNNLNSTLLKTFGSEDYLTSLSSTATLYVWVDYDGDRKWIDLRLGQDGRRPCKSLIAGYLDLTNVLLDTMHLGFSSSTGAESDANPHNTQTTIFDWSLSTSGKAKNIYGDDEQCGLVVSKTETLVIIVAVLSVVIIAMLGIIFFLNRRRSRKVSDLEREKSELVAELNNLDFGARAFSYQQLAEATNGFTQPIGKGGFGTVYKGALSQDKSGQNTIIAVKKITKTTDSLDDAKQLVAEVKVIGRLRHINIVPVLGWCYERGKMFLVYKYMENGDLDQWVFPSDYGIKEKGMLCWAKRMSILRGVASALKFLHEDFESDETVLHRDIKTRNIMIDSSFNARLGDFGLARFCKRSSYGHQSQQLVGTIGYIAPEYLTMGASQETDVYSFGVLALVVATSRKPLDRTIPSHGELQRWVRELNNAGRITDAGDSRLKSYDKTFDLQEMERVLKMGLACCNYEPLHRPLMHDVVTALQPGNSSIFSAKSLESPYPSYQKESFHELGFPAAEYDEYDKTLPLDDFYYSSQDTILNKIDIR